MINSIVYESLPNIEETEIESIALYLCRKTGLKYDKFNIDSIKIDQCISQLKDMDSVIHVEMTGIYLNIDQYMIDYVNDINYYKIPYIDIETKEFIIKLDFLGIFDFNFNGIRDYDIATIARRMTIGPKDFPPKKENRWTRIASSLSGRKNG